MANQFKLTPSFVVGTIFSTVLLSGCGGSGGEPIIEPSNSPSSASTQSADVWWDAPLPDFSENPDRPTINLVGEKTQVLTIFDEYQELGATASDEQDGDLTSQVVISGEVNSGKIGDYVVRYLVTDSSGLTAIEKTRIVRIKGNDAENLSRRPLGSTRSNFGYLEHLPTDYGETLDQKPPLLIYLHGSGANAQFSNTTDPTLALDLIINNFGIPRMISDGEWDETLPFVVLMPQLGAVPSAEYPERIDAFVEYATRAYDIDSSRVYLMGWSNGGFISFDYTVNYPDKIAAVVPIASGLPYESDAIPSNFCGIENVPMWLFHGMLDETIQVSNSIAGRNVIIEQCQPNIQPRTTLIEDAGHFIHHSVSNLSAMVGGDMNAVYDQRFESYDISIYEWLLSHSLQDRVND